MLRARESQAEKLASFSVCARQRTLAWPGRPSGGSLGRVSNMCENTATSLVLRRCTHLVRLLVDLGQHCFAEMNAGLEHVGACRRRRRRLALPVGRDVEAAQRTRLGEIGKSENAPLFLQLCARAVAHNCRQEAPPQHFFLSLDVRIHANYTSPQRNCAIIFLQGLICTPALQ